MNPKLKPMPVTRESVNENYFYIWAANGDFEVVTLNTEKDGLICMDGERDEWWFSDNLIGVLYGPIDFEE